MIHLILTCSGYVGASSYACLVLLAGVGFLSLLHFAAESGDNVGSEGIDPIGAQLEKLARLEANLKAKYASGAISREQCEQNLARIEKEKKQLEVNLDDSIAAMLIGDVDGGPVPESATDPLAVAMQYGEEAREQLEENYNEPDIRITDIKRGLLNKARALEVKFILRDTECKAIINSNEGRWHFSIRGESFYFGQFIGALAESGRFAEVFEKEVKRHPDDWDETIIKGQLYTERKKEKDTRDNFPEVCRRIIKKCHASKATKASGKPVKRKRNIPDLTGKPVVIHKVDHGEYTKVERKDFGRGLMEFPRYITVHLDCGEYCLKAEITTDRGEWEIVPRDPSGDYPAELLRAFGEMAPFMVNELERPQNKYLAHSMLTEMRLKSHRHQWEAIVKESSPLFFPVACRQLFEAGGG